MIESCGWSQARCGMFHERGAHLSDRHREYHVKAGATGDGIDGCHEHLSPEPDTQVQVIAHTVGT